MRLALVQADLGAPAHVGVRGPVDHEQGAFDAPDFPQGRRHLVLARIRGELAQDLARAHGPGGHGGRHAQDVRPVPVDQLPPESSRFTGQVAFFRSLADHLARCLLCMLRRLPPTQDSSTPAFKPPEALRRQLLIHRISLS